MKKLIISAIIAGIAISAQAQDFSMEDMGKPDPARVPAGTYSVDTYHSHIVYDVSHFGISQYIGLIGNLSGKLKIDPANPEKAEVEIDIPLSGLVSTSAPLDAHLKTSDFFDIEKFPNAKFKSSSVEVNGTDAVISGQLTIRDVTKPVKLQARLVGVAVNPMSALLNVGFDARTQIKRSDFGVSHYVPFVSDEVELRISVVFEGTE